MVLHGEHVGNRWKVETVGGRPKCRRESRSETSNHPGVGGRANLRKYWQREKWTGKLWPAEWASAGETEP